MLPNKGKEVFLFCFFLYSRSRFLAEQKPLWSHSSLSLLWIKQLWEEMGTNPAWWYVVSKNFRLQKTENFQSDMHWFVYSLEMIASQLCRASRSVICQYTVEDNRIFVDSTSPQTNQTSVSLLMCRRTALWWPCWRQAATHSPTLSFCKTTEALKELMWSQTLLFSFLFYIFQTQVKRLNCD